MTIGIIGAMDEEVTALLTNMNVDNEHKIARSKFYEGTIEGVRVILLQSGIGKVNASLSTAILHERFKPKVVINTGSAGGVDEALNVGDIVIGKDVVHHDADATAFGYAYGQIPQMPHFFQSDSELIKLAEETIGEINQQIKVKVGTIGTGDSFMSDQARVREVVKKLPTVKAFEMEAAAIAQVCYQYDTRFLIIRSLSDIAGKESNISFDQFLETAAKNSAELIIKMLKKIK